MHLAFPVTEARIQTLILCNTYCLSTATLVMTVWYALACVQCLSYLRLHLIWWLLIYILFF